MTEILNDTERGVKIYEESSTFKVDFGDNDIGDYIKIFEASGKKENNLWVFEKSAKKIVKMIGELIEKNLNDIFDAIKVKPFGKKEVVKEEKSELDFLTNISANIKENLDKRNELEEVQYGAYPRQLYKDVDRGILIVDYSEKAIVLNVDYKYLQEFCMEHYNTKSTDIMPGLPSSFGSYRVSYLNEMIKPRGYSIWKNGKDVKDFLQKLTGKDIISLCTPCPEGPKKSYSKNTKYEPPKNDVSSGVMNIVNNDFFKEKKSPADVFNELIRAISFPFAEIKIQEFSDSPPRKCIYGPSDLVNDFLSNNEKCIQLDSFNNEDNKIVMYVENN